MRLTWLSNAPWAPTGYGNQTRIFTKRIKDLGHEVAIIAFYGIEGGSLTVNGIPVFPRGFHPYGMDVARAHSMSFKADAMISLIDAWVCDPKSIIPVKWIPWFPIDSDPLSPFISDKVGQAYKRLVFSKHACRMMDAIGMDYDYIPHGVETGTFAPLDQKQAREELRVRGGLAISDDCFLVGMVAANKGTPSRKAFDSHIAGFAEFARKHTDAVLYLHTQKSEHGENSGVNLPELCRYHGLEIGKNVLFPNEYQTLLGWPDGYMQAAYSAMDVKLMATMGEGFGIPIVEAQSCGTPVIVGDWTANSELCFSGWKIPVTKSVPMWTTLGTNQYHVHPGAVADALQQAYNKRGNKIYRQRAREGALQYDADKVTAEYWKPYLEKLEAQISNE